MFDLSIIIVTWNNENEIIDCIDSIYNTVNRYRFEVIVVDNQSVDNTILNIINRFPKVRLINSGGNIGFSKANNMGVKKAEGRYILYLNPDTILLDGTVDMSIDCIKKNVEYGIIACKLLNYDKSMQSSVFPFVRWDTIILEQFNLHNYFRKTIGWFYKYNKNTSGTVDWCIGAYMLLRKDDVKKINGFSDDYFMYAEDLDLCYKVTFLLNKKVYYLSTVSCIHLGGSSEIKDHTSKRSIKILNSIDTFFRLRIPKKRKRYLQIYKRCYQIKRNIYRFIYFFQHKVNVQKKILNYAEIIKYINKKLTL